MIYHLVVTLVPKEETRGPELGVIADIGLVL